MRVQGRPLLFITPRVTQRVIKADHAFLLLQDQHHQQQQQQQHGLRMSRSCGNLAFMTGSSSPTTLAPPVAAASAAPAAVMLSSPGIGSPRTSLPGTFSG